LELLDWNFFGIWSLEFGASLGFGAWLHRLETLNAFQLSVFASRTGGQGRVTPKQAAAASAGFREDLENGVFLNPTPLSLERLEVQFEALALRHAAKLGFRTYDILHVASALILECDSFWSFDPKAAKLASLEGLEINLPLKKLPFDPS
jgi:predicted nucleic acid-binding protein